MRNLFLCLVVIGSPLLLGGCMQSSIGKPADTIGTSVKYDAQSWKKLIPDSCQRFYDGCNFCTRMPGETDAACTKIGCEVYTEPYCMDGLPQDETNQGLGEETLQEIYVGLSVDEATTEAEKRATAFRVVEEDGVSLPRTEDFRPGRINATVVTDTVTAITIE